MLHLGNQCLPADQQLARFEGDNFMNRFVRSKIFTRRALTLSMMLLLLLSLGIISPALARSAAAPPDQAATADEIAQLKEMVAKRDNTTLYQIAYWNSGDCHLGCQIHLLGDPSFPA